MEAAADESKDDSIALCASCDRCRSRKTKCDGERPCGNCAAKYMKKFKLTRYATETELRRGCWHGRGNRLCLYRLPFEGFVR
jgi:Fungal Zn(2)-Cys(6) binuclear cluster domain